MTFHVAAAYGVAVAMIALLGWMSARNRRSGWRRQRRDLLLDNLIVWAETRAALQSEDKRSRTVCPAVVKPAAPVFTSQLSALQAHLQAHSGVRPVASPTEPAKRHSEP